LLGFGIRGASLCAAPERWKLMTWQQQPSTPVEQRNCSVATGILIFVLKTSKAAPKDGVQIISINPQLKM
jgi:hypothetical protein